jgi:DtxR family Mn-dependent transcriptional regulator
MNGVQNVELSASLEDYLEAIFNLANESRKAHSKDIARSLGVSMPSVTGALRMLKNKGLANYRPYGNVTLTCQGQALAADVARRHDVLKSFFVRVLGVGPDVAQRAACKAEHALGSEIIARLVHFVDFVGNSEHNGDDLTKRFQQFCSGRLHSSTDLKDQVRE